MGKGKDKKVEFWEADPRLALLVDDHFDLAAFDREATPGWAGSEKDYKDYLALRAKELDDLQERLFAHGRTGHNERILLVTQGLDTAGKGGLARHVMGLVDPQGVKLTAFKKPTEAEQKEHFLERIKRALPGPGMIGFFDRSHYEDILVPAVNGAPAEMLNERAAEIAQFEQDLIADGCRIIKVCLMVSYREQGRRLQARLDRPDKYWKMSPYDLVVRSQWYHYQSVYQAMLRSTSTDAAPWMAIPADNKWYARAAVTEALTRTLEEMDLGWPEANFDIAEQRRILNLTMPPEDISKESKRATQAAEKAAKDEEKAAKKAKKAEEKAKKEALKAKAKEAEEAKKAEATNAAAKEEQTEANDDPKVVKAEATKTAEVKTDDKSNESAKAKTNAKSETTAKANAAKKSGGTKRTTRKSTAKSKTTKTGSTRASSSKRATTAKRSTSTKRTSGTKQANGTKRATSSKRSSSTKRSAAAKRSTATKRATGTKRTTKAKSK
ncbi:hypothetical protein BK816_06675 [Boudabousia tangfeifanii]|uniref:Polyphosphate kinase-2-related domain-containing protein n=1 Tax=Boudabousia tangfeifanii TaxID=1912795 RepID=A0A1D9MKX0_9ACTO|nr:PPK2 family polyphosphate kinase [Boudabousia tangfeifanii]AOZ73011.1 hypothetical protein BK816_06675 [Boudabousia tangfeifanii]